MRDKLAWDTGSRESWSRVGCLQPDPHRRIYTPHRETRGPYKETNSPTGKHGPPRPPGPPQEAACRGSEPGEGGARPSLRRPSPSQLLPGLVTTAPGRPRRARRHSRASRESRARPNHPLRASARPDPLSPAPPGREAGARGGGSPRLTCTRRSLPPHRGPSASATLSAPSLPAPRPAWERRSSQRQATIERRGGVDAWRMRSTAAGGTGAA